MREQEKRFVDQKLGDFGGNVALAAKSCGIRLRTMYFGTVYHYPDPRFLPNPVYLAAYANVPSISPSPSSLH
jgi:hypothetical protein